MHKDKYSFNTKSAKYSSHISMMTQMHTSTKEIVSLNKASVTIRELTLMPVIIIIYLKTYLLKLEFSFLGIFLGNKNESSTLGQKHKKTHSDTDLL